MSHSVSFILPVRDLQYGLRDRLQMILDVLSELTDLFDVLIVDYGSRDETREVALDLVREFPQVDFLDRGDGDGLLPAIESGIYRTTGEIVFVHDPALPLGLSALHSLWRMRDDDDLVMAQSALTDGPDRGRRDIWSRPFSRDSAGSSIQMIRRCAIHQRPQQKRPKSTAVDRVTRTDLRNEPSEALRLPKLLTRLQRYTRQ